MNNDLELPEEFRAGYNPLNPPLENWVAEIAGALVGQSKSICDSPEFSKALGLESNLADGLRSKIHWELLIYLLFWHARVIVANRKDDSRPLLDRLYYCLGKKVTSDDKTFLDEITARFESYHTALENQAGAGPMYWLGKAAFENIAGTREWSFDVLGGGIYLNLLGVEVAKAVKKLLPGSPSLISRILSVFQSR